MSVFDDIAKEFEAYKKNFPTAPVTVVFTNEHLATLNLEIMSMETKEDALLLSGMGRDSKGNSTPFKMAIPKANILQLVIYSR